MAIGMRPWHLQCVAMAALVVAAIASSLRVEPRFHQNETPVITTPSGSYVGINMNQTSHFLGIRYVKSRRNVPKAAKGTPYRQPKPRPCWGNQTSCLAPSAFSCA
jgi:hypothetical protein